LELTDAGFDFSVLSEFRRRLLAGSAEELLLDKLLAQCHAVGLLKARGLQRTDATHVLAAVRVLNRLELVAETLRAVLNGLATVAPDWVQAVVPPEWYERYGKRIEDSRLPREDAARLAYAQQVGEDGFALLAALAAPEAGVLGKLPLVKTLRQVWHRHYEQLPAAAPDASSPVVRFRPKPLPRVECPESPYDPEARYRTKRDTQWTGYLVHLTETCDPSHPYLITQVHTTPATVHEARGTEPIQQALVDKGLPPSTHLVDAGYVDAELLVHSQEVHGILLRGPTRPDSSWQTKVEGAFSVERFEIDWEQQQVRCPTGKHSVGWYPRPRLDGGSPYIQVRFSLKDCRDCEVREQCTRSVNQARILKLHPQPQSQALSETRQWYESEAGREEYHRRAGIEGTISQGVRAFGLRKTRYRGLAKTHLQQVATAAAMNIDRLFAWYEGYPRAKTRTSRFATLAPA
jgi:transposase